MENPSLELDGIPPERPPEALDHIYVMSVRERHGFLVAVDDQNVAKKAKGDDEWLEGMETDLLGAENRVDVGGDGTPALPGDGYGEGTAKNLVSTKGSYVSVMARDAHPRGDDKEGLGFGVDNVVVLDEDCIVDEFGLFPRLKFLAVFMIKLIEVCGMCLLFVYWVVI
ncbi:hypothetical protein V6N13_106979 [Hibiscus sabdariffa]|uniref:Uncharacterized protein n=1 Tax=Hibiscus sabdariffa TaxID=183260 RepID=A0ABR2F2C1_9ROSI